MRVALACVVSLTAACATLPGAVETPTADVRRVEIDTVGLGGLTGRVHLDVYNPNGFGVPLRRATWQLYIGDALAVSGDAELSQTIPARDTAPVVTSLSADAVSAARAASLYARGERRYRVSGTLEFSTRLGPIEVAFSHDGVID